MLQWGIVKCVGGDLESIRERNICVLKSSAGVRNALKGSDYVDVCSYLLFSERAIRT